VPRVAKRSRLLELIARHRWSKIGEPQWTTIAAEIPGIKPENLQELAVPVEAPWGGIRQNTLDELETSLKSFAEVYAAREDLRRFCRSTVIRAKDHAKWAARSSRVPEDKRRMKAEMAEWMLIWLGDPALFTAWIEVRRHRTAGV
jgi:hypothetical protein